MALLGYWAVFANFIFFDYVSEVLLKSKTDTSFYVAAHEWSMQGAAIAVFSWIVIASLLYWRAASFCPRLLRAEPISGTAQLRVQSILERICLASGMPTRPSVFVWITPRITAFACGTSITRGAIVVTTGLLENAADDELSAVIAHELAHLKHGDAIYTVEVAALCALLGLFVGLSAAIVVIIVAATVKILGAIFTSSDSGGSDDVMGIIVVSIVMLFLAVAVLYAGLVLGIGAIIIFGIVCGYATLGIRLASGSLLQSREYLADSLAVQWTRSPEALAGILAKAEVSSSANERRSILFQALFLTEPIVERTSAWQRFYAWAVHSHPPIERRIRILHEMWGTASLLEPQALSHSFAQRSQSFPRAAAYLFSIVLLVVGAYCTLRREHWIYGPSQPHAQRSTTAPQPRSSVAGPSMDTSRRESSTQSERPSLPHAVLSRTAIEARNDTLNATDADEAPPSAKSAQGQPATNGIKDALGREGTSTREPTPTSGATFTVTFAGRRSSTIGPDAARVLHLLGEQLANSPEIRLRMLVPKSETPFFQQRRAEAVARELLRRYGVAPDRIDTVESIEIPADTINLELVRG